MPDYEKMYHLLVHSASEVAETLDIYSKLIGDQAFKLKQALLEAEEIYITNNPKRP